MKGLKTSASLLTRHEFTEFITKMKALIAIVEKKVAGVQRVIKDHS